MKIAFQLDRQIIKRTDTSRGAGSLSTGYAGSHKHTVDGNTQNTFCDLLFLEKDRLETTFEQRRKLKNGKEKNHVGTAENPHREVG